VQGVRQPELRQNRCVSVAGAKVVVNPWYRQFYLQRGDAPWASDQLSPAGIERALEERGGFVYVGTSMYGNPVEVTLELHDDQRLAGPAMNGLWSFDPARRLLTLAHHHTWHIRVLACREALLFGRDAAGVACTLERVGPLGAREEVSRRP